MGGRFGKCLDSPGEVSSPNSFYRKHLEGEDAGRVRKYGSAKKHWDDFAKHMEETTPASATPTIIKYGGSKKHSKKKTKKRNSKKKTKKKHSKKKHSKKA